MLRWYMVTWRSALQYCVHGDGLGSEAIPRSESVSLLIRIHAHYVEELGRAEGKLSAV